MSLQQSYPNRIEMLAFKWYCVDEMTLVDIAKKLQMPMRTVKDWTTSVANWLHPRMLEALQQRGWEFNEMQRLPPKLRPAVAYMKACQAAHKEAERKMCQNPERKKRQATLDAAKRKVKSLMPKQRTAEQRSEEEKWKGKRITPQADYLKKCQEALKAAEREVKYLTPMK